MCWWQSKYYFCIVYVKVGHFCEKKYLRFSISKMMYFAEEIIAVEKLFLIFSELIAIHEKELNFAIDPPKSMELI